MLGFTGFMRDWHGLERVVELLARHSEKVIHFLVVGDGPARKGLEKTARSLGVESSLTITGLVDRDHIIDFICAYDIALQPDVVSYASPLKIFEYLALGHAIVAPDSENIREILGDKVNALLFNTEVNGSFNDSIECLADNDNLRLSLGTAAKDLITEKGYTWIENAKKVERLMCSNK